MHLYIFNIKDLTCHIVTYTNGCQGDDHKVRRLQSRPAFNVFEDHSRDSDEQDAASKDKYEGGSHTDFSLADLVVFILSDTHKHPKYKQI